MIKYLCVVLIPIFFISCASTNNKNKSSDYALQNLLSNLNTDIVEQDQTKIDFLNNLYVGKELYYEVSPGLNKWVTVQDITSYEYDNKNNLIKEENFLDTIEYFYNDFNNKILEKHSLGLNLMFLYDKNNFLTDTISNSGNTKYKNDNYGRCIYSDSELIGKQYFEYDQYGRKSRVITPDKDYIAYYTYLFEDFSYSSPSKDNFKAKITNNKDNEEVYLTFKNGKEVEYSIIKDKSYIYRRISEYDNNNNLIHKLDTIEGEFWYEYIYNSYDTTINKMITFKLKSF